jgi:tricarballylate dehydrogenase
MRRSAAPQRCDIIVVGGGTAAFEAAVAARQNGAEHVVMLEKAPAGEAGGNSRYTSTGWRFVHTGAPEIRSFIPQVSEADFARMHIDPYSEQRFSDDLLRVTQNRIDRALMDVLVKNSNAALHWLREVGIHFGPASSSRMIDGVHYFEPGCALTARGGEGAQYLEWLEIGKHWQIDLRYDSMVTAINGNARRVDGVRVLDPDGEYDLAADAVILCSGGFQSDPQLRACYLGRNSDFMKVRGSRHNTGEVLMMALELGAKPSGQWLGAHASPIDANAPSVEMPSKTIRYSYVLGITVNALGARFFDEGEAESVYTYAKTGWAVQDQPGGIAYQVFDAKLFPYLRAVYAEASVVEAPTLGELAAKIGMRAELLERTIADFNAAVREDVPFKPRQRDGKCTAGITPPKSNWATRIDTPPYRAYPVAGGITFTFGGLAVDTDARVLNRLNAPIAGLYASGDILGLFYHNYPSFSGQTRNAVFSRIAAAHAVRKQNATADGQVISAAQ